MLRKPNGQSRMDDAEAHEPLGNQEWTMQRHMNQMGNQEWTKQRHMNQMGNQ